MSDLLHDALLRATTQSLAPSSPSLPPLATLALSDSDDEIIPVRTPHPSTPALSVASTPTTSRSPSPSRTPASSPSKSSLGGRPRSGAGKPRRDKTKELAKAALLAATMDPLVKLPPEANVRVFGLLAVDDLLVCGRVSKRWRSSSTINWAWYTLLQSLTFSTLPTTPLLSPSGLPTWRRGDSKIDWAARYASLYRPSSDAEDEEDDDAAEESFKEAREEKWREENEERERAGTDKATMRSYYKSLGNSKIKGKSGKGMAKTWDGDGLGGGGDDYI